MEQSASIQVFAFQVKLGLLSLFYSFILYLGFSQTQWQTNCTSNWRKVFKASLNIRCEMMQVYVGGDGPHEKAFLGFGIFLKIISLKNVKKKECLRIWISVLASGSYKIAPISFCSFRTGIMDDGVYPSSRREEGAHAENVSSVGKSPESS